MLMHILVNHENESSLPLGEEVDLFVSPGLLGSVFIDLAGLVQV